MRGEVREYINSFSNYYSHNYFNTGHDYALSRVRSSEDIHINSYQVWTCRSAEMSDTDNSGSPLSRRHRFETFKTAVSIRNLYAVFKMSSVA